jgi:DeoR/GlpR family transcriptional regulator of sugar metabolism
MLPAERRERILRAVRAGTTQVGQLADAFGVSEMTVRRDLGDLEREGKLTRVHGGAVGATAERPFAEIAVERFEQKDAIGALAASSIDEGQTVLLDVGTTTLQLARHLRGRSLTVITSNLAVYEELLPEESIELVLLGGVVAEDALRQLRADVAFLGASGIEADFSVVDTTMVEVPIKRAMMAAAARSVLLVDSEKFRMRGVVRVCHAQDLDAIVTDSGIAAETRSELERSGVEVLVAGG